MLCIMVFHAILCHFTYSRFFGMKYTAIVHATISLVFMTFMFFYSKKMILRMVPFGV